MANDNKILFNTIIHKNGELSFLLHGMNDIIMPINYSESGGRYDVRFIDNACYCVSVVMPNNKLTRYNILMNNGELLVKNIWFDDIKNITGQTIRNNRRYNIGEKGEKECIVCKVKKDNYINYIKSNGEFVFDVEDMNSWPTSDFGFVDGVCLLRKNTQVEVEGEDRHYTTSEYNVLRYDGTLIFDGWKPYVTWKHNSDYGIVKNGDRYYLFDYDGNILGGEQGEKGFDNLCSLGNGSPEIIIYRKTYYDGENSCRLLDLNSGKCLPKDENEWLWDIDRNGPYFEENENGEEVKLFVVYRTRGDSVDDHKQYMNINGNIFDNKEDAIKDAK